MTYRRFSSLGPKTELTGPGYEQFKAKLAELKRIAPPADPQADILAAQAPEDAPQGENPPEDDPADEEPDPDVLKGIYGLNDGGYDGS